MSQRESVLVLERVRQAFAPGSEDRPTADFHVLRAVLDVLGVGLEPTLTYLHRVSPDAEVFDVWVAEQRGGPADAQVLARAERIIDGLPPTASEVAWHTELETADPVFDDEDMAHWHEHGYVILRDAAPPDALAALAGALWDHLGASPEDRSSWYRQELQQGIMVQLFDAPGIAEIHDCRRIQRAFAQLLGTTDLVMSTDRLGFNAPLREGERWGGARMHLDLEDYATPVGLGVQGILYLTDTAEDQGAFRCVPGFHRRIDEWLDGLNGRDPSLEDFDAFGPVSIAAGAGDLIIWRSSLPHGSQPNRAQRPRLVHYLTMYPVPRAAA